MSVLLIVIIFCAILFDYINGFHDAANSIATVVSTKVLTPLQAVIWAAFFNFAAFFIFKDHGVADTVSKIVKEGSGLLPVILSGLLAAIAWNLLTWWFGIPSSSSHTLIGGLAGAGVAHSGFSSINPEPIIKTVSFIVLAPLIGMIMAFLISIWFIHSFSKKLLPKLFSLFMIAATVGLMAVVMVTATSRIVGLKAQSEAGGGLSITEIAHNSPAQKMGLKKGDILYEVDGKQLSNPKELDAILLKHMDKDDIQFVISRKAKGAAEADRKTIATHFTTEYSSRFAQIVFYGENFKWLLLAFVIISIGIFTLRLSSLNYSNSIIWFKRMQLVSSAAFSIGHGGNDAQKVMGIITFALIAGGVIQEFEQMPPWVPLACYSAISIGTLSGGWKIIKTMGTRITKVTPFEGVAAETAGAITLFVTEQLKIPVSTTHTITGSIIGVGATKRLSAVRWGVTINLMWAWILTIPVSALLAASIYFIVTLFVS